MRNRDLAVRFYSAFQVRDSAAMTALYHPEARFRDEAFRLEGRDEIGAMWQMLCVRGKDLKLEFEVLDEGGDWVNVLWIASYSFSLTGRKVVNRIEARLQWRDGLIIDHRDRFNFWRWSRQALGLPGLLLGWTPFLRAKVAKQARHNLQSWRDKSRETLNKDWA